MPAITAIEFYLPERVLTTDDLASEFPEWSAEKIAAKTGIVERHIAADGQCSSDLAAAAAQKLFATAAATPAEIDYLLFCTQTADYLLPTTACVLQERLHIPTCSGALDFNLGCSGFVYGLGMAKGLIESGQASCVLLLTGETYSKFVHPSDRSVRTLFGDAGAACLIRDGADSEFGPFVYGTDGKGANNLIVPAGGMREPRSPATAMETVDEFGYRRSREQLFMNGAEIFNFTLIRIVEAVSELLERAAKTLEEVDLFVFHQANRYILDHLRAKLKLPAAKFYVYLEHSGNTVSSTIPIALKAAATEGKLKSGDLIMMVGFGVGYSWGATLVRWSSRFQV
jgi:3-oxoacyl-[acyl-carrier-protein] synthase-3